MDRPSTQHAPILDESDNADTVSSGDDDDDDDKPLRPRDDVTYVVDYPMRSSRSGLERDWGRGAGTSGLERNGGGGASAMLVMED